MASTLDRRAWIITLSAAAILMVTMGARQSQGLFVSPLNTSTGLGIATISFALAIGQFAWGAVQPVAGALSDRYGPGPVLIGGILLLAFGMAVTPFLAGTGFGLMVSLGILAAVGSGAGSFSVLISAAAQRLSPEARGTASGVINAGGSFGQFVFAPIVQKLIQLFGWMGSMWGVALLTLAALPLVGAVATKTLVPKAAPEEGGLWKAVRGSMSDRSYLLLHLGFFTCGFHIAFLVTHLPGEVNLCGLPPTVASWSIAIIGLSNIVGSLLAGASVSRFRSKYVLAAMYGSRALLIGAYLLAPKTTTTFYLFAAGLGLTWLATVPPTAAIVGKLFGIRYLATLFGLTLLSHQIGGFLGAYLGGLAFTAFGDYNWMWYADMALAAMAAVINLPIKEAPIPPRAVPA
ncbi:L-lactate transporter [Usitatibacter rugosus]|uniref:L-lactate transporter n=1 Tax=Usitatibacter rugosus TaxID=2732067 RepID=A0A6M4GXJ6_9PROT|nr:MFS transporter [Usitatibacter rugosus]QJR12019.1 L-lactate transporter [Usitatibacter rugosus]